MLAAIKELGLELQVIFNKGAAGHNQDAFRGALRLWPGADMLAETQATTLRIVRTPEPKKSAKEKSPEAKSKAK